jgi:hypothetical protein
MKSVLIALFTMAMAAAAASTPAATSDFTGVWKQNNSKSKFGPARPPRSYLNKIQQFGSELKVVTLLATDSGERTYEHVYQLNGKEEVTINGGEESHTAVHWADRTLVFEILSKDHGREYKTQETWNLSSDGKTLTKVRHSKEPKGEIDQTFVLEKQ